MSTNFSKILKIISSDSRLWSNIYKQRYGIDMPIDYLERDKQYKCGSSISAGYAQNPKPDFKQPKRKNLRLLALYNFRKEANYDVASDSILKEACENISKLCSYYMIKRPDGGTSLFEGYSKGTIRYNKKQRFRIMDAVSKMMKMNLETFCLTLTYDIHKWGKDRIQAWQNFTSHIQKTLHPLIKLYNAKITWVKESTAKGYPHAHCVIGLPKGTVKGYSKMKSGLKLKYGWLYDKIKNSAQSRIFDLSVVRGKNLKYYLTKYLTKDNDYSMAQMAEQIAPLSDEQRKSLMCFFYTTATQTRTIGISRGLISGEEEVNEKEKKGIEKAVEGLHALDITKRPTNAKEVSSLRRLRRLLTRLCINFPCLNRPEIYSLNLKPLEYQKLKAEEQDGAVSPQTYMLFTQKGYKISCDGCLFSHLANFIVNKYDDWFNPAVPNILNNSLMERYFKDSDYEDDFIFLNKLRSRLNFLIKERFISSACLDSVVHSKIMDKTRTAEYNAEVDKVLKFALHDVEFGKQLQDKLDEKDNLVIEFNKELNYIYG